MISAIHLLAKCIGLLIACALPIAAQSYSWRNVEIDGGGFVTGTVFHPTEPGLVYTRTDVGGIYRFNNTTQRWIPLNDQIGGLGNEFQHLGVLSIGLDPNDANRVYIATGQYGGTESWKLNSRIYRSTDRGNTWLPFVTPGFKMAGNGEARGTGERMAVDPVNGANILIGTSNLGIWRSTNYGTNWNRLPNFPITLTHLNFLLYAPASHASPGPNRRVYAAANTLTGQSFWFSDNNGDTWSEVPNHPGKAIVGKEMMPIQGSFDAAGVFYSTWGDATGPSNFATDYGVWKLSADATTWTSILPPTGQGFFSGISADPRIAGHVMISTLLRWGPRDEIYRSTDGGSTWTAALTTASRSGGNSPWAASPTPHWITDIDIDPFNSDRAIFNTGFGLFQSTNIAATGTNRLWTFFNDGLEELVPLALVSPSVGPPLVSVTGDYTGFRHDNLDRSPLRGRHSPSNGSNGKIAGALLFPEKMIRQNSTATYFSQDAAATWTAFPTQPPTVANGHGTAVLSPNGQRVLWCPTNSEAYLSTDSGATWTIPNGTSLGVSLTPIPDSVNDQLFYLWNNTAKTLLRSTDGGFNFTAVESSTTTNFKDAVFRSPHGNSGHLWVAAPNGNGLYRSTDSGSSFNKLPNISASYRVAFGRAAPGASHPTVFIWGTVSGITGFFRSDNAGSTWVRINDDLHQFGYQNDLAADPRVYGRVYLATSGRGVVIGEINSIPSPSQPTQLVYDDALQNNWSNASAGDTNLASASPVFSGSAAISVPTGTGKGVAFTSAPRSSKGFAAITFRVHGGVSSPPPALSVGISRGGVPLEAIPISPATAAAWQRIIVPLADLGAAEIDDLTGLRILSSSTAGAFSIDDIRLAGPDEFIGSPVNVSLALSGLDLVSDGSPKAATVTTSPAGVAIHVTYNGTELAPVFPGTYSVVATATEPNHTGSTTGTLILREPELPSLPFTAWTSNVAGKVVVDPQAPASPLLIPDGTTDDFSTNTLQASFPTTTLATTGDKLTLTGTFRLSTAGIFGQNNWFRFGLFDNRGQAPGVATGWLGYTGMGNSLYERISNTGLFSTGSGATQRFPASSTNPISSSSPEGNPQLAFAVTATRTTTGIIVTHLIQRTDTQSILMRYSYDDISPNNNGLTSGASDTGIGYNPVFNTLGFAFARGYISTTGATAQFTNVRVTFQSGIIQQPQTITFTAPSDRSFGLPPIELTATASSGLPVSFAVISGPATLSGSTLTPIGAGTITLRASQPGNDNFLAAPHMERSFQITKAIGTITLSGLSATYDGSPKTVGFSTVPANLPVLISYPGNENEPTNVGDYPVNATINDANYQGFASGTLVIGKATQTLTFTAPANLPVISPPVDLSATASSGLPVSFAVLSGPGSLAGNTLTITGTGTVVIRASQAGNNNYLASTSVDRSITIAKATAIVALAGLDLPYSGLAKPVLVATTPPNLETRVTYNGSPDVPLAPGNYAIAAVVEDPNYAGSTIGTLVIGNRGFTTDLTGWIPTSSTMTNANTSSPVWNPNNLSAGIAGSAHAFFPPIQLTHVGDSLKLTGTVAIQVNNNSRPTSNKGLWFRFGLFRNQSPVTQPADPTTNWLGYCGMINSTPALFERTATGSYSSSITGPTARTPQVGQNGANSTQNSITVRFTETLTRTAGGIDVAYLAVNTATSATLMSFTYSDTTPSNNGVLSSSQNTPTSPVHSPTFSAAGFAMSGEYIGTSNASAQFTDVEITYSSPSPGAAQTIDFAEIEDRLYGAPAVQLAATASSGLPVTYSIVSGQATLSGNLLTPTGIGEITVRASQAGNISYLAATPVERSFTVIIAPAHSTLDQWRFSHFASYENTGNAADLADPDFDNVPNLIEFALGLSPLRSSIAPIQLSQNGSLTKFTYTRAKAATAELSFVVEHSDSLLENTWTPVDAAELLTPVSHSDALENATAILPQSSRRFARLKVTRKTP